MRCRTGTIGHHSGTMLERTCDEEGYSRVRREGGSGEEIVRGSSSQARGI
jgi:hypothetical protein